MLPLFLGPEHPRGARTLLYFECLLLLLLLGPEHPRGARTLLDFECLLLLLLLLFFFFSQMNCLFGGFNMPENSRKFAHTFIVCEMVVFYGCWAWAVTNGSVAPPFDEPLHMVWPTEMKFVWLMYQPQTYKKVSWTHPLSHTGSPLFIILSSILDICRPRTLTNSSQRFGQIDSNLFLF